MSSVFLVVLAIGVAFLVGMLYRRYQENNTFKSFMRESFKENAKSRKRGLAKPSKT